MHKQSTEFDRTFFKTHKSRYTKFTPSLNAGFTLIELLVVISIIALLSTVVLAAVNDGRVKARNTAKNSLVLEYVKALELYRSTTNTYPSAGSGIEDVPVCVGYTNSLDKCYGDGYGGSATITSALQTYMPNNFADRKSIIEGGSDFKGILYACTTSSCNSYTLSWILEKPSQKCTTDSAPAVFGNSTSCLYTKR